ncbi:heterokaryon incompatibility protein [Zymoseptoria brevis]|uniref:Heterokaryon incompatibility protein n=1 Tax=Zymoseptoria brevis TaxID=1047168 RepID=A0A0F4H222_9PEZI|nr:heterokaryon incompatibility protein [Zymoseptoria brevis]
MATPCSSSWSTASASNVQHRSSNNIASADSYRIINLLPGEYEDPIIECRLQEVSLKDDSVEFVALSYCPGGPDADVRIWCDGRPLSITADLFAVLRNARARQSTVSLWVDQLCIDQTDTPDRNEQSSKMGQIYRAASGVVIWLGEESVGSSAAMQLPRGIKKYWPNLYNSPRELLQPNKTPNNIDRWPTGVWTAFMSLLERPWWRRIWAIQEVVCAREIILTCGTATALWDDFVNLVQVIDAIRHPVNTPTPGTRTTAQRIAFMQEVRSLTEQGTKQAMTDYAGKHSPALDILRMAKDCEATDHRDKLFACHHLVRLWDRPDYGMPIEMLYKRFALKYLSRLAEAMTEPSCDEKTLFRRQVEFIYTAGTCNQNLDLPSWVADWSVPRRTQPLWYENECYSAGGHEIKEIVPTVVERKHQEFSFHLPVTTKFFDRILAAGTDAIQVTSSDPSDLFVDLRAWLFQSMSLLHMHRNRSSPYTDLTTAIARTITVDQEDGQRLLPKEAVSRYEALLEMLRLTKAEPSLPIDNESQSTYHSVAAFLRGRVVFVTERGYIGLAQVGVAWGDTIAVMRGAPVPIVLRPTLETGPKVREYRMLCEAFVADDEVMNGGFWEGDVSAEEIVLL